MQARLDTYAWAAGVATDLINTAPEVMVSTGDGLADPAALAQFLAEYDIHPDALARGHAPTPGDLADVHELRRALRNLIDAPNATEAVTRTNALLANAGTGPVLISDDHGRWRWCAQSHTGSSVADELAVLAATGLLGVIYTLGHDRFRPCASPICAGVFVDSSRAGRRRYCEPNICGNRINVANYRARHRETSRGASPQGNSH